MDERDPEAFRALYAEHYGTVWRYLAARTRADQVEDLAAETFLIAWRRADAVPEWVLPWLLNVARKLLANQRRSGERAEAVAQRLGRVAALEAPGADDDAERVHQRRAVLAALATLSESDRELMLLHVWDDLPARQIAVVLGVSGVAARARLSRARRRLEHALREALSDAPKPALSLTTTRSPS